MAEEIINRVSNSNLKTFDLEEIYPEGKRIVFDIKDWLFEELILKEKDFRASVKNHDWSQYEKFFCGDILFSRRNYSLMGIYVSCFSSIFLCK
jgi:SpoVK/Ycf46/Vps4 family AAA+-type ATPase